MVRDRVTVMNAKGKVAAGGGIVAAIAAAALAYQQIGDVVVLHDEHDLQHAAESFAYQTQFIDVQIAQIETQRELIAQRERTGQQRAGDDVRKQRLIARIQHLEKLKQEILTRQK